MKTGEKSNLAEKLDVPGSSSAAQLAEYKYWAFISYSHRDKAWADWLHHKLESYHVPRALVGRRSRNGPVPQRLIPVFRDRDELSAAHDLGLYIKSSLVLTRYLVVICSPNSFKSEYVDEEIRYFKSLGREDRVFCLIVAGEPCAAVKLGDATQECFPPATQFRVCPEGNLLTEKAHPIAADARPNADGKRNALVKILSGLLDVNYDELKQREKTRRVRKRMEFATVMALILAAFLALWSHEEAIKHSQAMHQAIQEYLSEADQAQGTGKLKPAAIFLAAAHRLLDQSGEDDPKWNWTGRLAQASRCLISESAVLLGHDNWVSSGVFSPDGKSLLTASWDSSIRLWDIHDLAKVSSRSIPTFEQNLNEAFLSAAYNPSGDKIVCATWRSALCWVTDAQGDLIGRKMVEHRGRVNDAEFDVQGDRIVTASDDGTARLWTSDGTPIEIFSGHKAGVKTAVFNPAATQVLTASFDGTAIVWDIASNKPILTVPAVPKADSKLNCAAFSPDQKTFVAAGLDGKAAIYDLATGTLIRTFAEHHGRINSVVYNHQGNLILTASDDGTAKIWSATDGKLQLSLEGHGGKVLSASFNVDGGQVVTTGDDHTVRLWSLKDAPPWDIGWSEFYDRVAALRSDLENNEIKVKKSL